MQEGREEGREHWNIGKRFNLGVREGTDLICSSLEGKDGIREGGRGVCSRDGGWEKLFGRWGLMGKALDGRCV